MTMDSFTLEESQRQAVLLAIAHLALEWPGWDWMLGQIAERLGGRELFDKFKVLAENRADDGEILARVPAEWTTFREVARRVGAALGLSLRSVQTRLSLLERAGLIEKRGYSKTAEFRRKEALPHG